MSEESERESDLFWRTRNVIRLATALLLLLTALLFYFLEPISVNLFDITISLFVLMVSSALIYVQDLKHRRIRRSYLNYFLSSLRYLLLIIPFWFMLAIIRVSGGRLELTIFFMNLLLVGAILIPAVNPRTRYLRHRSRDLNNPEIERQVEEVIEKMGVEVAGIRVIDTGRARVANAFMFGFRHYYVYVTDYLLENLTTDENAAIIAHELAHISERHIQKTYTTGGIYILILGNCFFYLTVVLMGLGVRIGLIAGVFISSALSLFVLLPFLQRKFEREADVIAARLSKPKALIDSLIKISRLNNVPLDIPRYWNASHPSVSQRISYLRRNGQQESER